MANPHCAIKMDDVFNEILLAIFNTESLEILAEVVFFAKLPNETKTLVTFLFSCHIGTGHHGNTEQEGRLCTAPFPRVAFVIMYSGLALGCEITVKISPWTFHLKEIVFRKWRLPLPWYYHITF